MGLKRDTVTVTPVCDCGCPAPGLRALEQTAAVDEVLDDILYKCLKFLHMLFSVCLAVVMSCLPVCCAVALS